MNVCGKLVILAKRVDFEIRVVSIHQIEIGRRLILHGLLKVLILFWLFWFDLCRWVPGQADANVLHDPRVLGQDLVFETVGDARNLVRLLYILVVATLRPLELGLLH